MYPPTFRSWALNINLFFLLSHLLTYHKHTHTIRHLILVSFPLQEPGTEEEIKKFAEGYGVKFDMFSKIKVNGNDAHPLWTFLKSKQGGTLGNFIKWNFTKFLVDRNGNPVSRYSPQTNPIVSVFYEVSWLKGLSSRAD